MNNRIDSCNEIAGAAPVGEGVERFDLYQEEEQLASMMMCPDGDFVLFTQHQRIVENIKKGSDIDYDLICKERDQLKAEVELYKNMHSWMKGEVERTNTQLADQNVVLPERLTCSEGTRGYVNGWNDCLDEVARLNKGAKP